jgi:hypothetical protein
VRAREVVEVALAKSNSEQHVSPEIAQDSEATVKAMREIERSWQRGMDKIAERVALTSPDTTPFFSRALLGARNTPGHSLGYAVTAVGRIDQTLSVDNLNSPS